MDPYKNDLLDLDLYGGCGSRSGSGGVKTQYKFYQKKVL